MQLKVGAHLAEIEAVAGDLVPSNEPSGAALMWLYRDSIVPAVNIHPLFLAILLDLVINRMASWLLLTFGLGMKRVELPPTSHAEWPLKMWASAGMRSSARCAGAGAKPAPIIFLHGIGVGLSIYYNLLKTVLEHADAKQQPVWALELPHISSPMDYYPNVPTPLHTVGSIAKMLEVYYSDGGGGGGGFSSSNDRSSNGRADFVGHSYGTVTLTHILKHQPGIVRRCLFVDPICVGLHRTDLCRNFVYTPPRSTLKKAMQSHFINGGLKLVHVLMRTFWWWENDLLASDIEAISRNGQQRQNAEDAPDQPTTVGSRTRLRAREKLSPAANAAPPPEEWILSEACGNGADYSSAHAADGSSSSSSGSKCGAARGARSRLQGAEDGTAPPPSSAAATFFISTDDQYVPSAGIVDDLQAANRSAARRGLNPVAAVRWWPGGKHGDVCFEHYEDVGRWCSM